jgi:DNA polymerase III subunit gamma/tau
MLNCQNLTAEYEPCNECPSCEAFNRNASFNVTELDAASNNSVEHIRSLIDQVRFQPQQGKYKIFIIDEVHMLSQAAFNAFLKTLEEPPPYAVFILATTEKHKIIPTILSRCQIFDFKRIRVQDMVAYMQAICAEEGIAADSDALHIIAQKADGALRDALSIFDRIVAFSGKTIKYEDVLANLNVLDYDYYFKMVDALLTEDASQVLLIFDDIQQKGFEGDLFINGLAEHLRNLLVCKDPQTLTLLEVSDSLKERYRQQAALTPTSLILTALNIANECDINFKMARSKRLHVELALVKMTFIMSAVSANAPPAEALPEKKKIAESNPPASEPPASGDVQKKDQAGEKQNGVARAGEFEIEDEPEELPEEPLAEDDPADDEPAEYQEAQQQEEQDQEFTGQLDEPQPPPVEKKPPLRRLGKQSMPSLSGGIDAVLAEVRKDEGTNSALEKTSPLTLENIHEAWHRYVEKSEQELVKNVLKNAELKFNGLDITAVVGTPLAENTLRQEENLMEFLREELKTPRLTLSIERDKSKVPEAPPRKKILTPREKYKIMLETNPQIAELQKRFGLKPDEG